MYALTKHWNVPYETSGTTLIAVSYSVDALKIRALEDKDIFDEQWVSGDNDTYTLTLIKDDEYSPEEWYSIQSIEVV